MPSYLARFLRPNEQTDLKQFMIPGEQTFAYCTPTMPETCLKAGKDLDRYLEMEGPYDGVIAFSSGATFVLSWMINKIREKNPNKPLELPFKVGIFFSNVGRLAEFHDSVEPAVTTLDETETNGVIDMPTAHIWGIDDLDQENARLASQACNEATRSVYVHGKGHEVPMSTEGVISAVKAINRAIARAQGCI